MSGRGAYYKAKYGGGGRGGGGGGGGSRGGGGGGGGRGYGVGYGESRQHVFDGPRAASGRISTADDLMRLLKAIDGQQYGRYKELLGEVYEVTSASFGPYRLEVVYVQGDPYAAPSRINLRVPLDACGYPAALHSTGVRIIALCDYLTRSFVVVARREGCDLKEGGQGWGGAKGGQISMSQPGQDIIPRTTVQIIDGNLEVRFLLGLPATGRSIQGAWCAQLFFEKIPMLITKALLYSALDSARVLRHVHSSEDQTALRDMLEERGLIAFVRNGAVLPRHSGASDLPMAACADMRLFASPPSMVAAFDLPNAGRIEGMGIKKGVTLICGGGFHGKSTLLAALEVGVYNKVPGDGREFVVTVDHAVKIRAEDGRAVHDLDISPFINNLPLGKSTENFATACASGSTSQSANIIESLEMGSKCILLDEDTCATNFMFRDELMGRLVANDKEPITPFLARVRDLWTSWGCSTIMVVGGCGAFFAVADAVIVMDCFEARDATLEAKNIVAGASAGVVAGARTGAVGAGATHFPRTFTSRRGIVPASLHPREGDELRVKDMGKIQLSKESQDAEGNVNVLDLSGLEQIREVGQTRAICEAMQTIPRQWADSRSLCLSELLTELVARTQGPEGLDAIASGGGQRSRGLCDLSYVRKFELAGAINRWRQLSVTR